MIASKSLARFSLLCLTAFGLGACGEEDRPREPVAQERSAAAVPARPFGVLDHASGDFIVGWAWDEASPDEPVDVDIYDGPKLLATVRADRFRKDLLAAKKGNGKHAFRYNVPAALRDGRSHSISAEVSRTGKKLDNSAKSVIFEKSSG